MRHPHGVFDIRSVIMTSPSAHTSHPDEIKFPTGILYAAGGLILASMVLTLVARVTGVGTVQVPESSAVQTEEVRFEDLGARGIKVIDSQTGTLLAHTAPGEDGFVRGVLRGMNRTRKLEGIGPEAPFQMVRWSDGRLSLFDTATQRSVELQGFGATNLAAFAKLFAAAEQQSRKGTHVRMVGTANAL